jgi:hypothetical protein
LIFCCMINVFCIWMLSWICFIFCCVHRISFYSSFTGSAKPTILQLFCCVSVPDDTICILDRLASLISIAYIWINWKLEKLFG